MSKEIERKFLVDFDRLALPEKGEKIKQGYIPVAKGTRTTVRVRVKGTEAYLTIKGENTGAARAEYEYLIPLEEAEEILAELCQKPFIEKTRYKIQIDAHVWEIDIFLGENEGLTIAEIELSKEDEIFTLPDWALEEVTDDNRYYNSNLILNPFKNWGAT